MLDIKMKHIFVHIVTAARIIYTQNWKSEDVPAKEQLMAKIYEIAEIEFRRLKMEVKGKNMCL